MHPLYEMTTTAMTISGSPRQKHQSSIGWSSNLKWRSRMSFRHTKESDRICSPWYPFMTASTTGAHTLGYTSSLESPGPKA